MKLILLPGNSPSNREWIRKVETNLSDLFSSTNVQYYSHWNTGSDLIDLDLETLALTKSTSEANRYAVFAKSAGVVLALRSIFQKKINPHLCIFVGTPIHWARHHGFDIDSWLDNYSIATLFIQQREDFTIPFPDLKELLKSKGIKGYTMEEIPGDDHSYENIDKLRALIGEFMQEKS